MQTVSVSKLSVCKTKYINFVLQVQAFMLLDYFTTWHLIGQ